LPAAFTPAPPVYLPPLNRLHEPPVQETESVALPDWMEQEVPQTTVEAAGNPLQGMPARLGLNPVLVPRHVRMDSPGFYAKLSIPPSDEPLDDSWRERHLEERRRVSRQKSLDRTAGRILDSTGFRIARIIMLVATGGMCAGLALYLKDRKWVLDLPWKPSRMETIVNLPRTPPAVPEREAERTDPVMAEDPADLEGLSRPPVMAPAPEAISVPVSAAPTRTEEAKK
jgi:hypothetical protein